jgi:hypothetical protein
MENQEEDREFSRDCVIPVFDLASGLFAMRLSICSKEPFGL